MLLTHLAIALAAVAHTVAATATPQSPQSALAKPDPQPSHLAGKLNHLDAVIDYSGDWEVDGAPDGGAHHGVAGSSFEFDIFGTSFSVWGMHSDDLRIHINSTDGSSAEFNADTASLRAAPIWSEWRGKQELHHRVITIVRGTLSFKEIDYTTETEVPTVPMFIPHPALLAHEADPYATIKGKWDAVTLRSRHGTDAQDLYGLTGRKGSTITLIPPRGTEWITVHGATSSKATQYSVDVFPPVPGSGRRHRSNSTVTSESILYAGPIRPRMQQKVVLNSGDGTVFTGATYHVAQDRVIGEPRPFHMSGKTIVLIIGGVILFLVIGAAAYISGRHRDAVRDSENAPLLPDRPRRRSFVVSGAGDDGESHGGAT